MDSRISEIYLWCHRTFMHQHQEATFRQYQSCFFVKFFSKNLCGFIAALNHKRQDLVTILIIIVVIIEHLFLYNQNCFELPHDRWLTFQGENCYSLNPWRWNIWRMSKVCHWKCVEFHSLLLSRNTREPTFTHKIHVCKLNWLV